MRLHCPVVCTPRLSFALLLLSATPVLAQKPARPVLEGAWVDSTQRLLRADSAGNCQRAAQVLGRPTSRADVWAYRLAPHCGGGGAALANGLRQAARGADSALLSMEFGAGVHFDDATLFAAHLGIADDGSASAIARVHALRNALSQVTPVALLFTPENMVRNGPGCLPHRLSGGRKRTGRPLPPDAAQRLRVAATRLATDQQTPKPVQRAAACVRENAGQFGGSR